MHSSYHCEVANNYYSSRTELHAPKGRHFAPNPCFPAPHRFCPAAAEPLPRLKPCLCQLVHGLVGPQDWGLQSFPTAGPMFRVASPPSLCLVPCGVVQPAAPMALTLRVLPAMPPQALPAMSVGALSPQHPFLLFSTNPDSVIPFMSKQQKWGWNETVMGRVKLLRSCTWKVSILPC